MWSCVVAVKEVSVELMRFECVKKRNRVRAEKLRYRHTIYCCLWHVLHERALSFMHSKMQDTKFNFPKIEFKLCGEMKLFMRRERRGPPKDREVVACATLK